MLSASLSDLAAIWCLDFEFRLTGGNPAGLPIPVCMAGREFHSRQTVRLWFDGAAVPPSPAIPTGPGIAVCAFYASAEIGCFLTLDWPLPWRVLDLYTEFRLKNNGTRLSSRRSLLNVLEDNGLPAMASAHKDTMRQRILDGPPWSETEKQHILDYCAADADSLIGLLKRLEPRIDLPRALLRGRFMTACARMERVGIPIDTPWWRRLLDCRKQLLERVVGTEDRSYQVYDENLSWSNARFMAMAQARGIPWARHANSRLPVLDKDYFEAQCRIYPELEGLRQLRKTIRWLQKPELAVGPDNRNRVLLSPFGTVTGRNKPKAGPFIFGAARWLRGLIRPEPGWSIAYVDWSAQEIAVAAALSGDENLARDYLKGDPYMAFAIAVGLAPEGATKATHSRTREACHVVFLATNYGQSTAGLAARLRITAADATHLLSLHRTRYATYWRWIGRVLDNADLSGRISTKLGWSMAVSDQNRESELLNWPMQAHGAELMRLAAIASTEAGIRICGPLHDAFLVEALTSDIAGAIETMQTLMRQSGEALLGLPTRAVATRFDHPRRYVDDKPGSGEMWRRVETWLDQVSPSLEENKVGSFRQFGGAPVAGTGTQSSNG
jgi:hypothetical protein